MHSSQPPHTNGAEYVKATLQRLSEQSTTVALETIASELRHHIDGPLSALAGFEHWLSCRCAGVEQSYDLSRWRGVQVHSDPVEPLRLELHNAAEAISQRLTLASVSHHSPLSHALQALDYLAPVQSALQPQLAQIEQDSQLLSPRGEINDLPQLRAIQASGLSRATALHTAGEPCAKALFPGQSAALLRSSIQRRDQLLLHINLPGVTLSQTCQLSSVARTPQGLRLAGERWSLQLNSRFLPARWLVTKRLGDQHVSAIEWLNAQRQAVVTLVNLKPAKLSSGLRWSGALAHHDALQGDD